MKDKSLDYDIIVEDALRLVVKKSLEIVRDNGLNDDHHFYISFNSNYPGVKIPPELLNTGEDSEIKIILQHQFWDLTIDDLKFSVILSFSGKKKNIIVPFGSISSFSDPSVGFSLQFKKEEFIDDLKFKSDLKKQELIKDKSSKKEAEILSLDDFRSKK